MLLNQMRALGRNVLCELGQEIQRLQDLEVPWDSRSRAVSFRIRKGAASLLLGLVNDLPRVAHCTTQVTMLEAFCGHGRERFGEDHRSRMPPNRKQRW